MKILIVGGNGNISWHCTVKALQSGHEVYVLNRGLSGGSRKPLPAGVTQLKADIRDIKAVRASLKDQRFDAAADFVCYNREHAQTAVELFGDIVKQYLFISSTANYQRSLTSLPFTESVPLTNTGWLYARNKIECEEVFSRAHREKGFPVTIVRPGHTYDTIIPDAVGYGDWTVSARMLAGKPVVLHGDGTSLWTLTHSQDFAGAFCRLFGAEGAIGQAYHITGDELLTWREIVMKEARALGVSRLNVIYIPSSEILRRDQGLGNGLLGHKSWCDIYDNSKIKSAAPGWKAEVSFDEGIARTCDWFRQEPARQGVNSKFDSFLDKLVTEFGKVCATERLL